MTSYQLDGVTLSMVVNKSWANVSDSGVIYWDKILKQLLLVVIVVTITAAVVCSSII